MEREDADPGGRGPAPSGPATGRPAHPSGGPRHSSCETASPICTCPVLCPGACGSNCPNFRSWVQTHSAGQACSDAPTLSYAGHDLIYNLRSKRYAFWPAPTLAGGSMCTLAQRAWPKPGICPENQPAWGPLAGRMAPFFPQTGPDLAPERFSSVTGRRQKRLPGPNPSQIWSQRAHFC